MESGIFKSGWYLIPTDNFMKQIIKNIQKELKNNIDPKHREGERRFFKESIKNYGVRIPVVRTIARKYFKEVKNQPKQKIFELAEDLFKSVYKEEAVIAFQFVYNVKQQYEKNDFDLFENWLKTYASNWALCDDFCTHAFSEFLVKFPQFLPYIKEVWTKSENRWLKRASAVILIPFIKKHKKYLKDVFEISDILLLDKDYLVQKGYGWLLKEASNKNQKQVFQYVMRHKNYMPRTALRYAIEKMPKEMKQQAMAK